MIPHFWYFIQLLDYLCPTAFQLAVLTSLKIPGFCLEFPSDVTTAVLFTLCLYCCKDSPACLNTTANSFLWLSYNLVSRFSFFPPWLFYLNYSKANVVFLTTIVKRDRITAKFLPSISPVEHGRVRWQMHGPFKAVQYRLSPGALSNAATWNFRNVS